MLLNINDSQKMYYFKYILFANICITMVLNKLKKIEYPRLDLNDNGQKK